MTEPDTPTRHGGDLAAASARFGRPDGGWLDLSTGVNQVPYPVETDLSTLNRLPDSGALADLIAAARSCYRAPAATPALALSGSELAVRQLPHLFHCEKVAIVSPTYGSHSEAWEETGCELAPVPELDLVPGDTDVVVIGNPNSPDGHVQTVDPLVAMADRLALRGGALIVDEAYGDLIPETSLLPHLGDVPAVVLRSFGKFFGLPGLRLGFCFGPEETIERLAARIGDWPVSGLAAAIGREALADRDWQASTRARLSEDRNRLDNCFDNHGLVIEGGTDLFRLVSHPRAGALHAHLAKQGILTRHFDNRPEWIRFGVPSGDADLARLSAALTSFTGD